MRVPAEAWVEQREDGYWTIRWVGVAGTASSGQLYHSAVQANLLVVRCGGKKCTTRAYVG